MSGNYEKIKTYINSSNVDNLEVFFLFNYSNITLAFGSSFYPC